MTYLITNESGNNIDVCSSILFNIAGIRLDKSGSYSFFIFIFHIRFSYSFFLGLLTAHGISVLLTVMHSNEDISTFVVLLLDML